MKELGYEYGTALFMLAIENGEMQAYKDALTFVAEIFKQEETYYAFLQNPTIAAKERAACLAAAFEKALPREVLSFLQLLCEKGRMSCFFEAAKTYAELYDVACRMANATVTSAVALSDEQKTKLEEKLKAVSGRDITATYTVDASLLGGIIIEMDGKIIDGSLRHRLQEIKGVMNT